MHIGGAGLADDNAKVQAAAANMLNLALTLPEAPADLPAVLVSLNTLPCCHSQLGLVHATCSQSCAPMQLHSSGLHVLQKI